MQQLQAVATTQPAAEEHYNEQLSWFRTGVLNLSPTAVPLLLMLSGVQTGTVLSRSAQLGSDLWKETGAPRVPLPDTCFPYRCTPAGPLVQGCCSHHDGNAGVSAPGAVAFFADQLIGSCKQDQSLACTHLSLVSVMAMTLLLLLGSGFACCIATSNHSHRFHMSRNAGCLCCDVLPPGSAKHVNCHDS
jgi:hypothetical protein